MGRFVDLSGRKFGKLLVIKRMGTGNDGHIFWECVCDCGNTKTKVVSGTSLVQGKTRSCGCLYVGHPTHHCRNTATYAAWTNIQQRCENPNDASFKFYGARGITVCDRWKEGFQNFLDDMGMKPGGGEISIERIDNSKGYSPENCRWATHKEQMNNTRMNHYITFNNETLTMMQWSEKTNIPYDTLRNRINSYGWAIEKALFTPVRTKLSNNKIYEKG